VSEPCTACGACCAAYRVDFDRRELDGHLPESLLVDLTETMVRLRGTDHQPPRCAALAGRVGERVRCGVYEWRPGPCRELAPGSDACLAARRRHGLDALSPERRP
jgi:Fe-S-cluster containining protein